MKLRAVVAVMALSGCWMMAKAQMKMDSPMTKPMAGPVAPSKALDDLLSLFEGDVMGVAKAMPADKYDFAPSSATFAAAQGAKFDGVRTFAQEVTHLISANYYFYSSITGVKADVDLKAIGAMTKKDDILAAFAASFAFAHKAIATITPANAFETIKGVDGMTTRATVAAFGPAHGYDHYGQMVEYLRMNGIVPPGSK
jgi:uncharacterized damage-inducible protein DinB